MKRVFLLTLCLPGLVQASMIGYSTRDCRLQDESRGVLRGKEVCVQEVSCFQYLNNPNAGTRITQKAYCRPDRNNICLDPQDCLMDNSLQARDIPQIKPKYETDDSCNCSGEASSSSSGGWPNSGVR